MEPRNGWRRSITSEPDDRELVAAFLKRADETSFRILYRAHTSALYRLACRFLDGRDADAEEAVQSTWIIAVQRLADFRWESSLKTWLSGIVLNACREIQRRKRAETRLPRADAQNEGMTALHPAPGARLDLEKALAGLPEGYREALILHDVEGYTHEEIGRLLGIDTGTSKSQLSRARKVLRMLLEGPETAGERSS